MNSRTMSVSVLLAICLGLVPDGPDAHGATVTVVLPQLQGASGADVKMPIAVREAQGLGPLQMDVVYDPSVLEVKTVSEGGPLPVGLFDFHVIEPGRLRIAMTGDPQKPIQGDGSLLLVTFLVRGESGKRCELSIENLRAWEQTAEAMDMRAIAEPGHFTVARPAVPGWLPFAAGAALLLVIVLLFAAKRKCRKSGCA